MMRIVALAVTAFTLVLLGAWLTFFGDDETAAPVVEAATQPASGAQATGFPVPQSLREAVRLPYLAEQPVRRFEVAETLLEPDVDYHAAVHTSQGVIVIDLFEQDAPVTVNNFVFLARHKFYDGVSFHRVIDDFMAQTGDPTGTGRGGPGYRFDDEVASGLTHDRAGVVSMANSGPNTNGSQFFMTLTATPWLDGKHTVFGHVTDGEDVLERLTRINPTQPDGVVLLDDPINVLSRQGRFADLPTQGTVRDWLEMQVEGELMTGSEFEVQGQRGVVGKVEAGDAAGFFPNPDRVHTVQIFELATEDTTANATPNDRTATDQDNELP